MSLERAIGIELEWNPFSAASRAARAEQGGRISQALHLYVKAGQYDRVRDCLACSLPKGPVQSALISAASEWLDLWRGVNAARARGLPTGWTDWFSDDAQSPAEVLWRTADRVAAFSLHNVDSPRIRQRLQREVSKLTHLTTALHEARVALAELALSEGGQPLAFQKSEGRLRALAQAVQDLDAETEGDE